MFVGAILVFSPSIPDQKCHEINFFRPSFESCDMTFCTDISQLFSIIIFAPYFIMVSIFFLEGSLSLLVVLLSVYKPDTHKSW